VLSLTGTFPSKSTDGSHRKPCGASCFNREVFVGDIVLLKDPEKSDDLIVRRLAAVEGYEIVSTDEKDEPFVLDKDQCWVVADNQALKAKVWVFWYTN
jgi:hypothetical protein